MKHSLKTLIFGPGGLVRAIDKAFSNQNVTAVEIAVTAQPTLTRFVNFPLGASLDEMSKEQREKSRKSYDAGLKTHSAARAMGHILDNVIIAHLGAEEERLPAAQEAGELCESFYDEFEMALGSLSAVMEAKEQTLDIQAQRAAESSTRTRA